MQHEILESFGLTSSNCLVEKLKKGLINSTWKVTSESKAYILQQINKRVFTSPEDISENMLLLRDFLAAHAPDYLFVSPIASSSGSYLVQNSAGDYFRLMPFVSGSHTHDTVNTSQQAFEAAKQFGKFNALLSDFDSRQLHYTIPDFHNLALRFDQFKQAYILASQARLTNAVDSIWCAFKYQSLVATYQDITSRHTIPLRVTHHDTKISNILFDENDKGLCVIDLDTVMPGYFISDLGDMMRTYLPAVSEEEQDLHKVAIREDYFKAILEGYFSEMVTKLTDTEKELCLYAGPFMIYMQAIRFLTDYLKGDVYYATTYPDHNLVRAQNQFALLESYMGAEERLQEILENFLSKAAPSNT